MSESAEKPCGSLALLGDYDSDEKEASPEASEPAHMETDEKTDIEVARASSAEADSEQPGSPVSGPDHSSILLDEKKSDDEFKIESSSREDEPMETSSAYRGGPCLSEDSSDDESDDEDDVRKSPVDQKQSHSPKQELDNKATSAVDINSKLESPKTMEETVSMDYTPAKAKSESPDESLDCDYGEKPKSPPSDLPTSPKTEEPMEWDSSEQPEEPSSSELIVQKKPISPENFDDLLVMSGENSSSPKQLADSSMDKPKSRGSSKSPGQNPASPLEAPRSPESLKNSEATPARKSPTPESSNKIDDNSVSTAVRSSVSPAKDLEDKTVEKSVETKPVIPVEEDPIPDSPQSPDASDDSDNEEIRKTDTSSKPRAISDDDEAGTSSEGSGSMSRHATPDTKPWQSPRQQPVDGVVQPRTNPPPGKPTRHTNCLDYVLFTVIKDAVKHKHSWPFQFPVDANKLEIPEYHNLITRPMDLHTIEQRIRNIYYWSAQDAIQDINQLFSNCYKFNPPEYDVYKMAKTLERQIQTQLKDLPRSEKEQEFPDHQRKTMFLVNNPNGKPKTPQKRGRKSTRGRKKGPIPRSTSSFKESMDSVDDQDDASSKVDSVNFDDDHDITIEKDEDSQSAPIQAEVQETKPSTSQPPAKKRKVENGDNGVVVTKAATPVPTPAAAPATPAPVPRKNPNSMIDWKNLPPRWQGKQSEWQKFCSKLIQEMHSLKNKGFAQVFYLPVDPIKLKIFDYLDVIKTPMDLQTIKKKLDHKQYIDPEEFVADMNLMVDNCCTYNPKGSAVHQNALELKALFDERWKLFPRPGVSKIVSDSYINQSLIVNTDLVEDERINSYLSAVKAEEKKCAEKLEQLRSMSEGLYTIAMQRREAKLAGNVAPALAPNQLNQLDKLGINISNAPIMVPELISPALSVRSSNRAPVPKIIDDIGPSPIKARKISKPRPSNASIASTPAGNARGRKPKSGRPRKSLYSPAPGSPAASVPVPVQQRTRSGGKIPYISIYGRTSGDKSELSDKIRNVPELYVHPILRMIQLAQLDANKDVYTLLSLCDEEVDFNDAKDDLVIEILDYLEMSKRDKARALRVRDEIEVRAKFYGFEAFDSKRGIIPKNKINPAPFQNRLRSDSPSPSASRRSSDSESESDDSSDSDSEPPAPRVNPAMHKRHRPNNISATSSRGSTPAAAAPSSRPHKAGSSQPGYTLSEESSSSSDSNGSSDSSDSDSEPEVNTKKYGSIKKGKDVKMSSKSKTTPSSLSQERGKKPTPSPKDTPLGRNVGPSTYKGPSPPTSKKPVIVPTKGPSPPFKKRPSPAPITRPSPPPTNPTKKPSPPPVKKPSPPPMKKPAPPKRPITILDELLPATPAKGKEDAPSTSSGPSRVRPGVSNDLRSSLSPPPPQEPPHDWRKMKEEHLKRKAAERAAEPAPYMDPDEVLLEIERIYGPVSRR